ncbi:molybdenum cofactor guanylyltransferase MobA [Methyloligella sp. 2.7D]|uniref:molybdenum cofactor guanylyltransferase MobA n=1 Tax=unclassified Methyloligella TaxID=2625955 RepID=UPI00157D79AF|nr:molybdenum cofactor guanylyltransferase MobA [Methyloligella sp. GL2]QKP78518.1 molybdenum cofactor guanylyltransferase MobA [Methyloligella sp. GL2]
MTEKIAGLLLAGGRSSRFGRDKTQSLLGGETLLARALMRLGPQVSALAISSNADPATLSRYGRPVLADALEGYAGPLAGVAAGLAWARETIAGDGILVTAAADTPFFPEDLAARLAAAARETGTPAMAASQSGTHPTFAAWPLSVEPALADYLQGGGRKLHDFMARAGALRVEFPVERLGGTGIDPFFNINTPDDLAEAERHLAEG